MTTTQHTKETATALLAARAGTPPLNPADEKELSRIITLFDNATDDQEAALNKYVRVFRAEAQIRAYERVVIKLTSWITTAVIMGQPGSLVTAYEDKIAVQCEMIEALRVLAS